MKRYVVTPLVLVLAGCGGGSPTDANQPPGATSYAVRILVDSATVDPAVGQRCQVLRLRGTTTPSLPTARFTWSSQDESIATVSSAGEVVLHRAGETQVRATLTSDASASATQRIRVNGVSQPLFGEFSVVAGGTSTRVDNNTIAGRDYQIWLNYGVAPAYANGLVEFFIDEDLRYRANVAAGAADRCANTILIFRWPAGTGIYGPGPHMFRALLRDANGSVVHEMAANFIIGN